MESNLVPNDPGADEAVTEAVPLGLPSTADVAGLREGLLAMLRGLCRRKRVDISIADDLCNEAFRILLERVQREPLRDPDKVAAFLAQTARNLFTADARKYGRRRTTTGDDEVIVAQADPSPDVAERLQHVDLARVVQRVLKRMTVQRDREILVRYYLRDEDKAEICQTLGLSEEHFNRVIDRARSRFAALLDPGHTPRTLFSFVLL
jgi:RNA polymerase sigma-70 factor (ECF subfamily)